MDDLMLNEPVDVSVEAERLANQYFLADAATEFDPAAGRGKLRYKRAARKPRVAFGGMATPFEDAKVWEFPPEYVQDPCCPFEIAFVGDRAVRLRMSAREGFPAEQLSLMLDGKPKSSKKWTAATSKGDTVVYTGPGGSVTLAKDPWHVEFRDPSGRLLTRTQHPKDTFCLSNHHPVPFSFTRRASDLSRQFAATFTLAPDEKIFGCGESFTRLDKRGQKIVLGAMDPHGALTQGMYKPIPFFLSSRGYGMFVHAGVPMTFDFGHDYDAATTLHVGDDVLDLFVFLGDPKEILTEYTALTGRSPMPPVWSFGLWMSRITYKSEKETREVARRLRKEKVPCDVIHLDTGWFETDWRCDYEFSKKRFNDPAKMIADLKKDGFHVSLWQLPYFTPTNKLYREAIDKGYVVRDQAGNPSPEDATVDFSNPAAVKWYQGLLAKLLKMGVGAIKADFGEAAPLCGLYASGRTGWHEHALYPLRYNKAVYDITKQVTGDGIIWGRSAWAGSQRYPIHWGGDAENTDCGMAATLRAGLSLGLCGFTFWSHDIGGFVRASPEELYNRWTPFGMLTSHSRCHGAPPKEPWAYSPKFLASFRRSIELKYRLMPYILAQSKISCEKGWPLTRPLFFEFPEDRGSWLVEDQYMFGSDLLVAPLMEAGSERDVYLPPGCWLDFQDREAGSYSVYKGPGWFRIKAGEIPAVILVPDGVALPMVALAQSTDAIDWTRQKMEVFAADYYAGSGRTCFSPDGPVVTLAFEESGEEWRLKNLADVPKGCHVTVEGRHPDFG